MPQTFHALLIGINAYQGCTPLSGCINDVLAVHEYMSRLCAKQEPPVQWNPTFLLAPANAAEEAQIREKGIENYLAPTRQNIIAAFELFAQADPVVGDTCLLYYSGHGSYLPAPDVFLDCEPSGQLQTIVCVDSRLPGGRDLLDKELGYLVAKALEGKQPMKTQEMSRPGVHFLAITDSCHSGTNMRGDEPDLIARMTVSGNQMITAADILGFTRDGNCFYEKFEAGQTRVKRYGGLKHARYVKCSSAQDSEKAFEKTIRIPQDPGTAPLEMRHGVFTYALLQTLYQSGADISYGELMRRIQMDVAGRVSGQIPMLDNTDVRDDELLFLRNAFSTPKQEFEVNFQQQSQEWLMNAGAIHGIVPSSGDRTTLVHVSGKDAPVAVLEVRASSSLLDPAAFGVPDQENRRLSATIAQMDFYSIPLGFGPTLSETNPSVQAMRQAMLDAWKKKAPARLTLVNDGQSCDLQINRIQNLDGSFAYMLNRPGSRVPLFERHNSATTFLADVEKVARFETVLRLSNPDTEIPRNAFRIDAQVMEGVPFRSNNLDALFNPATLPAENLRTYVNPDRIEARFTQVGGKMQQPAFKASISIEGIPAQSYWVGALYCDSQFGIQSHLLSVKRMGINGDKSLHLEFRAAEGDVQKWDSIPVLVDSQWRKLGVTEVTDYILFFISTADTPFDLRQYNQDKIALDRTRSLGFSPESDLRTDDWFTIKIPLNIRLPELEQHVTADAAAVFPGFTLKMPAGAGATVQATNLAAAKRRVEQLKNARSDQDFNAILPPGNLWTSFEDAGETFSRCPVTEPDRPLSILELKNTLGNFSTESPLEIVPHDPLSADETILPFAYDEKTGLYHPVGYTDERGVVCVTTLPKPSSGVIGADGVEVTRNISSSIKLFFRKVVWSKLSGIQDYQSLVLLKKEGAEITRTEYHGRKEKEKEVYARMQEALAGKSRVLLLLHGFTGDARNLIQGVFENSDIHQQFDAVLAFLYENLGTSNRDTAKDLQRMLRDCGVTNKSITVIGHSMGGLVARWWVEREGGDALVKKLIQVGTPNGGTEITELRDKFSNLLTLGFNGMPALEPYKSVFAFIGRGIDKTLFKTIGELQPGSEFLSELNKSAAPENIPYYLIAGDTSRIEAGFDEHDPAWKKLYACLRDRVKYIAADYLVFDNDPNDMVVKTKQMEALPWRHAEVVPMNCDHFGYFSDAGRMEEWLRVLGS